MSQKLFLKWNNHMNVMNEFKHFLSSGTMIDVTLACDGHSLKAHKIVLSACSSFFKSLFLENPCKHPIVILKDVKYTELKAIIDFMYCGEVSVEATQVSSLVKIAQTLKVNGLGEVETQNDHSGYESENPADEEYDSDESINESVCTLDVRHGSFVDEQSMIDQNDNGDSKSEIVIIENPEIKKKVLAEYNNRGVSCSSASTVPFQSQKINSSKSKKDMPNLEGQTLSKVGLTRQSIQSSERESMPSLISITPTHVSPGQTLQSSVKSDIKNNQNDSDNMPSLVSVASTHVPPGQSFLSSAQSSMLLNKSHLDNMSGLFTLTPTPVSRGQSLRSSALPNMELNKNHSDNVLRSLPVISTPVSQGQSFQSSALANMKLNKNILDNMPSSLTVTSTHLSQKQSFQSSTHQNLLDNMPSSLTVTSTSTPVSRGQSFQPIALSNKDLHQNLMHNMPSSLTVIPIPVSGRQSAKLNKELHQNHSDNMHGLPSVTSTLVSQGSFQSSVHPSSVSVTSTCVSSNAMAIDSQQSSTSSASGSKMKKKMKLRSRKLPSRLSVYALQKEMKENEVYQPPNLRKPEILIINECHSKKNYDKIKDSRKTNSMKKVRKKTKKNCS